MLKKLEVRDPSSCLNNAERDEPIFVLRANDELAPDVVREWARMYDIRKRGLGITQKQIDKLKEALALADQMERWKQERSS